MTLDLSDLDLDQVCPYLGLADDPATHYGTPSSVHRCYATSRPEKIEQAKQAQDCLTATYIDCSRYHPPAIPPPPGPLPRVAIAGPSFAPGGAVARVVRTAADRRLPGGRQIAEVALVTVLAIGVIATGMFRLGSRSAGDASNNPGTAAPGAGGSSPSSAAGGSASPSALATPSPTPAMVTPSPTPTAIPDPSPAPSVRPAPSPTPLVYVVKTGDTLSLIARAYGLSVAAIKAANRVENPDLTSNPNLIFAGQRIVIPDS